MIKRIDIKDFREIGYLQELNRRFLHPLGLALEVVVDNETGEETLGGIWDYRDDPEGMIFDEIDEVKAADIQRLWDIKGEIRQAKFGWVIQPIDTV
jgi:hypothetical protein